MKKKLYLTIIFFLIFSVFTYAAPLGNFALGRFSFEGILKIGANISLDDIKQHSPLEELLKLAKSNMGNNFKATVGVGNNLAVQGSVDIDRIKVKEITQTYNSLEANVLYKIVAYPSIVLYSGIVKNSVGEVEYNLNENLGFQIGAQSTLSVPILGTIYALGAYGNTKKTYQAGISVPAPILPLVNIDAGYKSVTYIGNAVNIVFQGPFIGASFVW